MAPTSTVTLNGTASTVRRELRLDRRRPAITLATADTANPTFIAPASTHAADADVHADGQGRGWRPAVDGPRSSSPPTPTTSASTRRASSGAAPNGASVARRSTARPTTLVTFTLEQAGRRPRSSSGTQTPTLAAGVCSFDFRLKNAPAAAQPTAAGTITVTSVMGGPRAELRRSCSADPSRHEQRLGGAGSDRLPAPPARRDEGRPTSGSPGYPFGHREMGPVRPIREEQLVSHHRWPPHEHAWCCMIMQMPTGRFAR